MSNLYQCKGYNFRNNNEHLLGEVGNVHTLDEWLEIAYPHKNAKEYFEGYKDKEVAKYLHENMAIRLVPFGGGK